MPVTRISKDELYLGIAQAVAKGSTCFRSCYGAVIVKNDKIISTGYNGAPRDNPHCIDSECRRKLSPSGTDYDVCPAVHAEENALMQAGERAEGATLYLAGFDGPKWHHERIIIPRPGKQPCHRCRALMRNAQIFAVIGDNLKQVYGPRWING